MLDRIEKRVEDFVNNVFTKGEGADIKTVDIAQALRHHLDDKAVALTRERTVVPNSIQVHVPPAAAHTLEEWGLEGLAMELTKVVEDHAASQGYVFLGPVRLSFVTDDPEVERLQIIATTVPGSGAPVTAKGTPVDPMVEINGDKYLLNGEITVIGRGSEADIVVDDSGVSRKHLELRRQGDKVIATDLSSTNGSYVEGNRITSATLLDGNTLTIGRTKIYFWASTYDISGR